MNVCSTDHVFEFAVLSERVVALPPIWYPKVPEDESDVPTASVDVATEATPDADVPYRTCPEEIAEVVESPYHVMLPDPPTSFPSVVGTVNGPENDTEEVATP